MEDVCVCGGGTYAHHGLSYFWSPLGEALHCFCVPATHTQPHNEQHEGLPVKHFNRLASSKKHSNI